MKRIVRRIAGLFRKKYDDSLSFLKPVRRDIEKIYLERMAALQEEMACLGWSVGPGGGLYNNPLLGIGSALEIANRYGITLHHGTSYGECRAELRKERWLYPLRPDVDDGIINPWIRNRCAVEEVDHISTWGRSVQEAVARMLINGRRAGVI